MASGLKMNQDDRSRESRESRSCVERFPDVSRIPGSLPKATSVKQQIRDTTKLQDLYDVQVQVDSSRFNRFQHASIATGKYLTWSLLKDVESIATTLSYVVTLRHSGHSVVLQRCVSQTQREFLSQPSHVST
jgi:hypothetical protein